MSNPYLFPVPASALRPLLDHAAQTGRVFTEQEATLDIMLALDREDVKPIRYYVKRWGWTRYEVHKRLRVLKETALEWRNFFGQSVRQDQTDSGQDQTKILKNGVSHADYQTDSGQDQTDSGQYSTDTDNRLQKKIKDTHSSRVCARAQGVDKFSESIIESIYQAYPRHVGKKNALKAIEKSLTLLARRDDIDDAASWLQARVQHFARSPAGQAGRFTPHPATWFNAGRYDDNPREWTEKISHVNGSFTSVHADRISFTPTEAAAIAEEAKRIMRRPGGAGAAFLRGADSQGKPPCD